MQIEYLARATELNSNRNWCEIFYVQGMKTSIKSGKKKLIIFFFIAHIKLLNACALAHVRLLAGWLTRCCVSIRYIFCCLRLKSTNPIHRKINSRLISTYRRWLLMRAFFFATVCCFFLSPLGLFITQKYLNICIMADCLSYQ